MFFIENYDRYTKYIERLKSKERSRNRGEVMKESEDQYTEDDKPTTEEIKKSTVAVRADSGKDPWHLFMWDAARVVVQVLGMGAEKYSERNWEKGMKWSRCYNSAQRHLYAWFQEHEDYDKESGLLHLGHAAWNILVLLAYQIRGGFHVENDDRPNIKE